MCSRNLLLVCTLGLPLILVGCASNRIMSDRSETRASVGQARLTAVHAAAGTPVSSFRVGAVPGAPAIYAWQALNNRQLLIYTRPREAWLLTLGSCPRLFQSPFVAVTSSMNQVDHFSRVFVMRAEVACRVRRIQPIDVSDLQVKLVHRGGAGVIPERSRSWRDASNGRLPPR